MYLCRFAFYVLCIILITSCSEVERRAGKPWHHTTEGFRNPLGSPEKNTWMARLPWLLSRPFQTMFRDSPTIPFDHVLPKKKIIAELKRTSGSNTVTWLGHMTALLRIDGKSILTDPWLTSYASPIPPLGPKLYIGSPLNINELPQIDFVVISHDHFDHLDLPTIASIPNRIKITAIVPLGIGKYFKEFGYGKVIELDWEQSIVEAKIMFTALPVIHWSKRSLFSANKTLWAGWAIKGESGTRVFFGGDAEYGPIYKELAKKFGGFDLSLLSIGAFLPRVIMQGAHCIPEECIRIGHDLRSQNHLAMHWGTLQLGDDTPTEAPQRFKEGAKKLNIPEKKYGSLKLVKSELFLEIILNHNKKYARISGLNQLNKKKQVSSCIYEHKQELQTYNFGTFNNSSWCCYPYIIAFNRPDGNR